MHFVLKFLGGLILIGLLLVSCKKNDSNRPVVKPLPIDTAQADQYVICKIDTILFVAYTKGGVPNKVFMKNNSEALTTFSAEEVVTRGSGVPLTRTIDLLLYDFQIKGLGTYTGPKIFSFARTDVLVGNVDAEEKNWDIFNAVSNRIQVTKLASNIAKGNFNFKMRNRANPKKFIEVREGIFKIRYR